MPREPSPQTLLGRHGPTRQGPTRRRAVQAGSIGMLGLADLCHLRSTAGTTADRSRAVILIFLSGGLAQHESFDPKPDGPLDIRGEFAAIPTRSAGVRICEHPPMLAARSDRWALCRSLSHGSNEHSAGHHIMLTGRSQLPTGFDPGRPKSSDWPSIPSLVTSQIRSDGILPRAIVLPERIVHRTGRTVPGQFAGMLGRGSEPWFVECSPYNPLTYGAYPEYLFHHATGGTRQESLSFRPLELSIPSPLLDGRLLDRVALRDRLDRQRAELVKSAEEQSFDRFQHMATSLLLDPTVGGAFDISQATSAQRERYGENAFGWSLLMASRLVEAGVSLVQVNLGNNETWDTHQSAWTNLRRFLLPPLDRAVSGLLDDLQSRGLLDTTLVAMAGEFGRTPTISTLAGASEAGRDHWGRVQTALFAGGGVRGGTVVGATDRFGGEPVDDAQRPEDFAATLFHSLGLSPETVWHDESGRPFPLCEGRPIYRLFAGG
ncbi:MAG: DUF1501 domain-containing protein [Planctomycetaceae bacterium]